eukprot:SAG31_NODE_674_length_12909_cov_25.961124_13_plen_212_part_00
MEIGSPADNQEDCDAAGANWNGTDCVCNPGSADTPRENCYDTCTQDMILTAESLVFLDEVVMREAAHFLQDRLLVNPVEDGLHLRGSACYRGYPVDTVDPFPETDFYVTVTAAPQDSSLATGIGCEADQFGRPIAGLVTFNVSFTCFSACNLPLRADLAPMRMRIGQRSMGFGREGCLLFESYHRKNGLGWHDVDRCARAGARHGLFEVGL